MARNLISQYEIPNYINKIELGSQETFHIKETGAAISIRKLIKEKKGEHSPPIVSYGTQNERI